MPDEHAPGTGVADEEPAVPVRAAVELSRLDHARRSGFAGVWHAGQIGENGREPRPGPVAGTRGDPTAEVEILIFHGYTGQLKHHIPSNGMSGIFMWD